jgi:dihydroxyacetone kinase
MKFYGGADEGDRTMIDALQPALAALLAEPENLQAALPRRSGRGSHLPRQQSRRRARVVSQQRQPARQYGSGAHAVAHGV